LNGVDVSKTFNPDPTNRAKMLGLLTGMVVGTTRWSSTTARGTMALQNWPSSGPILSFCQSLAQICTANAVAR
jgi:hypothetical protein